MTAIEREAGACRSTRRKRGASARRGWSASANGCCRSPSCSLAIWLWDRICVWNEIPRYILPRPGEVLATLYTDAGLLFGSLLVTLRITFLGLALAVLGGVGLAVLFAQSKWVEMSFFPSPSSCR